MRGSFAVFKQPLLSPLEELEKKVLKKLGIEDLVARTHEHRRYLDRVVAIHNIIKEHLPKNSFSDEEATDNIRLDEQEIMLLTLILLDDLNYINNWLKDREEQKICPKLKEELHAYYGSESDQKELNITIRKALPSILESKPAPSAPTAAR